MVEWQRQEPVRKGVGAGAGLGDAMVGSRGGLRMYRGTEL